MSKYIFVLAATMLILFLLITSYDQYYSWIKLERKNLPLPSVEAKQKTFQQVKQNQINELNIKRYFLVLD